VADLLTVAAALLVAAAVASYVYAWPSSDRDARLGDGLFLVGIALVLFADEVVDGRPLDVAVAVGAVLLVGGLSVKIVRPFTPARSE
jgi:hypothetical protein